MEGDRSKVVGYEEGLLREAEGVRGEVKKDIRVKRAVFRAGPSHKTAGGKRAIENLAPITDH